MRKRVHITEVAKTPRGKRLKTDDLKGCDEIEIDDQLTVKMSLFGGSLPSGNFSATENDASSDDDDPAYASLHQLTQDDSSSDNDKPKYVCSAHFPSLIGVFLVDPSSLFVGRWTCVKFVRLMIAWKQSYPARWWIVGPGVGRIIPSRFPKAFWVRLDKKTKPPATACMFPIGKTHWLLLRAVSHASFWNVTLSRWTHQLPLLDATMVQHLLAAPLRLRHRWAKANKLQSAAHRMNLLPIYPIWSTLICSVYMLYYYTIQDWIVGWCVFAAGK